mgnify:CR=1 FL=1
MTSTSSRVYAAFASTEAGTFLCKLDGKAEKALEDVNITVNKNTIPFDKNKPFIASGIRIGTPALTTRGMMEEEMKQIGKMIASVIWEPESEEVKATVRREVQEVASRFPMYPGHLKLESDEIGAAG